MRGRSGEGRRKETGRPSEADIDFSRDGGGVDGGGGSGDESGHEHGRGKHNGERKKGRYDGVGRGCRQEGRGAGGGRMDKEKTRKRKKESGTRGGGVSIAPRVEKDLRANFPRSPNLILIPPQRTPSF